MKVKWRLYQELQLCRNDRDTGTLSESLQGQISFHNALQNNLLSAINLVLILHFIVIGTSFIFGSSTDQVHRKHGFELA